MKMSKEILTFGFLADRPDAVQTVAEWDYEEWGKVSGNSVQKTIERISGRLNRDKPPLYILAISDGRVLRAFLWKRGKDLNEATVLTGRAGQIIAIALIIFGLFVVAAQGDTTGLWTVLVGLFLYDAAAGIINQLGKSALVKVGEVMSAPVSVSPDSTVTQFVDHVLPLHRQTVFLVAKDKRLYGVLALEDMKSLAREKWGATKIQDVMRPIEKNYFVETETLLSEANVLMRENGVGALGIVDAGGNLVGFLQNGAPRKRDGEKGR